MEPATDLFTPCCAITTTQRRRFFWVAWWTAPPRRVPFRPPDASGGGEPTYEAARAAAERAAGRELAVADALWARAQLRVLRGGVPFPSRASETPRAKPREPAPAGAAPVGSVWAELGVAEGASLDELRRAYRRRALETHPDRGGDAAAFRRVKAAYEEASRRARRPQRTRTRGGS